MTDYTGFKFTEEGWEWFVKRCIYYFEYDSFQMTESFIDLWKSENKEDGSLGEYGVQGEPAEEIWGISY
jgi:hypothetical protein